MTIYLDAAASTRPDPRVLRAMWDACENTWANPGSRHVHGHAAQGVFGGARAKIASVFGPGVEPEGVILTSGATEANNLVIRGLETHGERIAVSAIEHKSVLEPAKLWGETLFVPVGSDGRVDLDAAREVARSGIRLLCVMHVNNETGIVQPLSEIASVLPPEVHFHVDAVQGHGRLDELRHERIDSIAISGHKIHAPKGVGALILRRRPDRPANGGILNLGLNPQIVGGGQQRGLRSGTQPVSLAAALGRAVELADREREERERTRAEFGRRLSAVLEGVGAERNGSDDHRASHVFNVRIPGVRSEALMIVLKDLVSISNGSACTSSSYEKSHVLRAMGLSDAAIAESVRFSWVHEQEEPDWDELKRRIGRLRS